MAVCEATGGCNEERKIEGRYLDLTRLLRGLYRRERIGPSREFGKEP